MKNVALLISRSISNLGSVLTSASVLLFLAEAGRAQEIPYTVIAFSFGLLVSTRQIVPQLSARASRTILLLTSILGGVGLALAACVSLTLPVLVGINLLAGLLVALDNSTSQAVLGEAGTAGRWVHFDTALGLSCRALGPMLAAALLLTFSNQLRWVFAIDSVSYFVAAALYATFLPKNEMRAPESPIRLGPSFAKILSQAPGQWVTLILVALGAGAYNVGAIIFIRSLNLPLAQMSVFLTAQNSAMIGTSLMLTRWPSLVRHTPWILPLASVGLFGISLSHTILGLCLSTALMAVGMVFFLSSLRVKLAASDKPQAQRRLDLATMGTINSIGTIASGTAFSALSALVAWPHLLQAGAGLIATGALILVSRQRRTRHPN